MEDAAVPLLAMAVGGLATVIGSLQVRATGANTRAGRRLAGARPMALRDLRELTERDALPAGAVRVEGRVRCADPIGTAAGEQLALLHRDVEIQQPDGRWRVIERLRDSRPIDLWQRAASVPLDLGQTAEPLIGIPQFWEGAPSELGSTHRPALERLTAEHGPPQRARATTRQVMLVDELIVLAHPVRARDGSLRLEAPPGGFLVATVELDVAMRLLAGPHRTRMVGGFAIVLGGIVALLVGGLALVTAAAT